jgi:L-glyceraldehyde 3-phosphate reductase
MLNRWIESELLDTLQGEGIGCIGFSALAQGLLSDKYLDGTPADARINRPGGGSLKAEHLSAENLARVHALNGIAKRRGQSLAQMALAWVLRDARLTTALIGASSVAQVLENVKALENLDFAADELAEIDRHAQEGGIDLWRRSSTDQAI